MNKKIKNAEKNTYDGIVFRSLIEKNAYILLKGEEDFEVAYEQATFTLSPGIVPTVPFWRSTKRSQFRNETRKTLDITYTPDFIVRYNEVFAVVEMKGFPNDVYPVKRKLFRNLLEHLQEENPELKYIFFEIKSIRELKKAIQIIRDVSENP